ncbi:hypothetical protein PI124_g16619 [Phytophthora idaei]|nr:hypothetical protein PI125_g16992 [Phytophthora idaei]KAG3140646.1 hypothetical protein PI126_g15885 [Phytophthora idaei]KAG3238420.1 hypothetical protein PI124_g16619 [Phytophthora idaei]
MGNICSCCSKRERSVEDLLDGSLEDKLLGMREDDLEATTAEEEAWRQRRQQVKDVADLSMKSQDGDDENGPQENDSQRPLVWDLSDRNTVLTARKEVTDLVEDEDEKAFGSAKEDDNDDDQETKEHVDGGEEFNLDRLTQLSVRSGDDSYASMFDSFREDTRLFRDTELDRATEVSDTFLAPSPPSSLRGPMANSSFLVDDEDEGHEQEQQQKEEHDDDQAEEDNSTEKHRTSSSSSSRKRSSKKKPRSKKSTRK